jgi:hypothetical protein
VFWSEISAPLFASSSSYLLCLSSARKDRFVYGGAIFVDAASPHAPGSRSTERSYSLLFTNLDMSVTRYLHHEVERRISVATYAQPRWIPAPLLLDANLYDRRTALFGNENDLTVVFPESSRLKKTNFLCGTAAVRWSLLRSVHLCCKA